MHKAILVAQKKFQPEKIKIEGVAFISNKKLKSHFREPKKRFFSISYFEKCFYMYSLPTAILVLFDQISVHPTVQPAPTVSADPSLPLYI